MTPKVLGDYQLVREIGQGGMGIVYEARQISLDKRVALKILPFAGALNPRSLQRFQNEAKAAAQLQHANIVPVYGVGCDRGTHFYAMQYIEGNNLAEVIRYLRHRAMERSGPESRPARATNQQVSVEALDATQPLEHGEVKGCKETGKSSGLLKFKSTKASNSNAEYLQSFVQLAIQASEALQHAHDTGVVHRDIKPSNLILDTHGNVWITDFGLAQMQGDTAITATGEAIGTLRYMSPEQALAKRIVVDHRTDIYSLGATLYELLTLKAACDGSTRSEIMRQIAFDEPIAPRRIDRRIPVELETIVTTALAKNPDERYQTAREMADDLRRFQSDEPIERRPPNLARRVVKWARRHRGIVSSAAATATMVFLSAIVGLWFAYQAWSAEKDERIKNENLLKESDGLRLAAQSMLERPRNPGLALLLAIKGRRLFESIETNNALQQALDENYELRTLRAHSAPVGNVAFSPDGRYVVTAAERTSLDGPNEPARIWDVETGKLLHSLVDSPAITSSAFSPQGGRLLTASSLLGADKKTGQPSSDDCGTPSLYDVSSARKLIELKDAFLFEAHAHCFSPNGRSVVVPTKGNRAQLYDVVEGIPLRELAGHTDRVDFAAMSPSGKFVVTISRDLTVRLWDAATAAELRQFKTWKNRPATSAIFSHDERYLATGSSEGAHLWDVATGQLLNPVAWNGELVKFNSDSSMLLTAIRFATEVQAYDTKSLERKFRADRFSQPVRRLEMSPDGEYFAVAAGNALELRQVSDGSPKAILLGHERQILTLQFSPTGQQLISGGSDKTARLWSIRSGAERERFDITPRVEPKSLLAFAPQAVPPREQQASVLTASTSHTFIFDPASASPVADFLGSFDKDSCTDDRVITIDKNQAVVWDRARRQKVSSIDVPGKIGEAMLSADGQSAVLIVYDGPVLHWNLLDGRRRELKGHTAFVSRAALTKTGEYLVTSCRDGSIRLWRSGTGELLQKLQIPSEAVWVEFSPAGDYIIATSDQNTAHVWRVPTCEHMFDLRDPTCRFNRASFSASGNYIISHNSNANEAIACWRGTDGQLLRKFEKPTGRLDIELSKKNPVLLAASSEQGLFRWDFDRDESQRLTETGTRCSAFSSDERTVVSATFVPNLDPEIVGRNQLASFAGPAIQFWDIESGKLQRSITAPIGAVNRMYLTPNHELVISARCHGAAIVNVNSLHKTSEIVGHAAPISAMRFGPRAEFIATASWDHTAAIWDPLSGRLIWSLRGHTLPVNTLAVHPSKSELATGAANGEIIIWNTKTGDPIRTIRGHEDLIYQVLYHPQKDLLLSNSRDGTIRLWNPQGEQVNSIKSPLGVFLSITVSARGDLLAVPAGEQIPSSQPARSASPKTIEQIKEQIREGAVQQFAIHLYRSWESIPILLEHDAPPQIVCLNNDGTQAVTVDNAGAAYLWKLDDTPQRLKKTVLPNSKINSACFRPGGQQVLAGVSNNLTLWDVTMSRQLAAAPSGRGMATLPSRTDPSTNPFSSDGKWILMFEQQKYLRRWPTDTLPYAQPLAPGELTSDEKAVFHIREAN